MPLLPSWATKMSQKALRPLVQRTVQGKRVSWTLFFKNCGTLQNERRSREWGRPHVLGGRKRGHQPRGAAVGAAQAQPRGALGGGPVPRLVTRETEFSACTGGAGRVTARQGQRLTFLHLPTAIFKQKAAADVRPPREASRVWSSRSRPHVPCVPGRRSSALSVSDRPVTWLPAQRSVPGRPWLRCVQSSRCVPRPCTSPPFLSPPAEGRLGS